MYHSNPNQKEVGMAILISEKMRFQCKEYYQKKKKRHYIIIKGSKQLDRRLVRDTGTTALSNTTIAHHHITGI